MLNDVACEVGIVKCNKRKVQMPNGVHGKKEKCDFIDIGSWA